MSITIDATHAGIADITPYQQLLHDELAALQRATTLLYADDRASINLPLDRDHLAASTRLARKYKDADLLILIGIGGSNLGTLAVADALLGRQHNLLGRTQLLCADTCEPDTIIAIRDVLRKALKARKRVVLNLISKSGATTESIANFEILIKELQVRKDWRERVVVTTDDGSMLGKIAHDEGFATLRIPKKVGGRYSVFSPVGLFPLAVLGVDVARMLDGAAHMRAQCLRKKDNPAMLRAAMLYHAHKSGTPVADNFLFHPDLESVGKWYRQLMGESIGKEWNRAHTERLWTGITPTVSIGSTDLHSMAQLYFGGPRTAFHTLVTVQKPSAIAVPRMPLYDSLVPNIQGKPLGTIMRAISDSVEEVLADQRRPYCAIRIPTLDATHVGELLQLHMMEMMLLAALLDVNAFDQPNVEEYKIGTKRRLA